MQHANMSKFAQWSVVTPPRAQEAVRHCSVWPRRMSQPAQNLPQQQLMSRFRGNLAESTYSMQTCQNSHATHMRMQQDSPHGFQRARPFCNNNRQACHLPRAYCAKRVLGYSSLSSSSLNSFIVFVAKIETHNFSEENRRAGWAY